MEELIYAEAFFITYGKWPLGYKLPSEDLQELLVKLAPESLEARDE